MTKGILTNNETGDTLHVTVKPVKYQTITVYNIDGTGYGGYIARNKEWTFTPDKPSVTEQFAAFPVATTFVTDSDPDGSIGYWVKLSAKQAIHVSDGVPDLPKKWGKIEHYYRELFEYTVEA